MSKFAFVSSLNILGILGILVFSTETLASIVDDIYKQCGITGGVCHGMKNGAEPECYRTKNCDSVAAIYLEPNENVTRTNRRVIVDIYGKAGVGENKYIALGISDDRLMGKDLVFACTYQSGATPEVLTAWNTEKPTAPTIIHPRFAPEVNILSNKFTDGKLSCKFIIPKKYHFSLYEPPYDLSNKDTKYFLLIAEGPYDNGQMTIHSNKLSSLGPILKASTLDWSTRSSCSTYHVWLIIYAIGVIVAALI